MCLVSYCEKHLQPHYDVAQLKKHKLVEPSKNLQENICSRHDEVMKMFCRTDQQCICYLCSVDEHKGHDTVSAAAERTERQRELEGSRQQIQQRIQDIEKDVKVLQQEVEALNRSAEKTVEDSEKIFTELICLMEKRSSEVKQQIRSQQETEVSRVKELQEKLEQEITELKRKDAELEQLSHTEDQNHTNQARPCLASEIGRDRACSGWYGRKPREFWQTGLLRRRWSTISGSCQVSHHSRCGLWLKLSQLDGMLVMMCLYKMCVCGRSCGLRPYHPEHARSRPISEAKQGRAWLVLGWETAWEYQVL
ncbi:hypothetical protein Q8A73_015549 [Channa argus]|nr:hypothetical protein Q8A73_015547 [Channa argus]KAK2896061.1 hypothetical protein Q8A73_015549 [Channa argus]